jgi:hypothetical protein
MLQYAPTEIIQIEWIMIEKDEEIMMDTRYRILLRKRFLVFWHFACGCRWQGRGLWVHDK